MQSSPFTEIAIRAYWMVLKHLIVVCMVRGFVLIRFLYVIALPLSTDELFRICGCQIACRTWALPHAANFTSNNFNSPFRKTIACSAWQFPSIQSFVLIQKQKKIYIQFPLQVVGHFYFCNVGFLWWGKKSSISRKWTIIWFRFVYIYEIPLK